MSNYTNETVSTEFVQSGGGHGAATCPLDIYSRGVLIIAQKFGPPLGTCPAPAI
jgi:hypothetical protein